jgi:H+/Cl- antiporter ClcA
MRSNFLADIGHLLRWTLLALPVAVLAGSASALFLWSLEQVTVLHWQKPWLLWWLPVGGVAVGLLYHYLGKGSDKGNNLLIDEIHQPGGGVPARMAPLVLIGTLVTHLFGGSAGREGTAVQMGGSLAALLARWFRVGQANRRLMLMCGIAAGFGAVFGTPLTGAIFAMEVLVIGRVQYEALIPVLVASVVGDATCSAWGVHHTVYHLDVAHAAGTHAPFQALLLGKVALAGIAFGLGGQLFSELTHRLQRGFAKAVPYAPARPILGAVLVIALVPLIGTRDYLGLGVEAPPGGQVCIVASFQEGGATPLSWLWKTIFTSVTLASGFKGGEVTPLFFIGSTMGNVLGALMQEPVALFAALGFIAIFAGAANTPLACTVMGIELFGAHDAIYFAVACFVAYFFSGHSGIYLAQRLGVPKKDGHALPPDATLREAREMARMRPPKSGPKGQGEAKSHP